MFLIDMDFRLNFGKRQFTGRIFLQSTNLSGEDPTTDRSLNIIMLTDIPVPLSEERSCINPTQVLAWLRTQRLRESARSEHYMKWSGTQDNLSWLDTDYLEAYSARS